MTDLRQIARDPAKALRDLENELGAAPGELDREMARLQALEVDWSRHVPYAVARAYPTDAKMRKLYAEHVNACEYCTTLIETLHPSDMQIKDFAAAAVEAERPAAARRSRPRLAWAFAAWREWPVVAVSAAIFAFGIGLLTVRDFSPVEGLLSRGEARSVENLTRQLRGLVDSDDPKQRFHAADIYFDLKQPQLAYQEIGAGLEHAGVNPAVAEQVANATVVDKERAAPELMQAAHRVKALKEEGNEDPAKYLELSVLEGKLGNHGESMQSLRKYLAAEGVDASVVAQLPDADRKDQSL